MWKSFMAASIDILGRSFMSCIALIAMVVLSVGVSLTLQRDAQVFKAIYFGQRSVLECDALIRCGSASSAEGHFARLWKLS